MVNNSNPRNALILFAKCPEPGKVKTRLSPPLSEQAAADLYQCMIFDTLSATADLAGVCRLIFFDGEEERSAHFRSLAPDALICRQVGNDLGERLAHAFQTAFDSGFLNVVVIGTDAPHMPAERVTEALSLMEVAGPDLVLGPSEDGGYYLIAMRSLHRQLLRDMPWSSGDLLQATLARAEESGLATALLLPGFDLDTFNDLQRLSASFPISAAPRTMALLRCNREQG